MKVILAEMHGKPVPLEIKDGIVYLDEEAEPIKNITEKDLQQFQSELDALAPSNDPGYEALVNAVRADFLAKLLGGAVGDECVSKISHILDHVHYDVLKYLNDEDD